jgi:predicted permease
MLLERLGSLARALFRTDRTTDIADELRFHLDARVADLVASGLAPAEARRRARLEFGAVDNYREQCREARGFAWLDDLRADLLYAGRTLRRSPAFAAVAIVSLALGIGANTLAFSLVRSLVLRPLPIDRPGEVWFVQPDSARFVGLSFPNYRDLRDRAVTFSGLAGYRVSPMNIDGGDAVVPPARAWGYLATGNYFDVLGITPALGRVFHADDDVRPGAAPLVVLGYDFWTTRFAADRSIVGRSIRINRGLYTVIGVAPRGFRGVERFYPADAWVPMMMQAQIEIGNPWLERRATANTWVVGRLKPGVSAAAGTANLNAVAAQIAREYPDVNNGLRLRLAPPGFVGDALGQPVKAFTFGLLTLAALVLLVACANLASVLAARGADRQRELAIRISIGAGRARIVRQLLTESILIALAGGAAGCALAFAGAQALSAWHAPIDFPVQMDVAIDRTVLLFAAAVSIAAGVVFGVAPARRASRVDPGVSLKDGHDGGSPRRYPLRDLLVAAQVALCFVLIAGSLLSLRGLQQALTMPLGFEPAGVTMVGFDLGMAGYPVEDGRRFQQRALEAVQRLPGVASAAYGNSLPLSIDQSRSNVSRADQPLPRGVDLPLAIRYEVSPGYFRTLGARIVQGRDIDWRDGSDRPPVAVVNLSFAKLILQTSNAVGRRFRWNAGGTPLEVIGVVEDGKYTSLTEAPTPAMFVPMQQAYNSTTTLLVRSAAAPEQIVAAMRQAVGALDPSLTLYGAGTVEQMLGFVLFPNRMAAVALTAFGVLGIVLAATGINGTVAYAVSQRRREIGIRVAVGATAGGVLRVVLGRMIALVVAGAAAGSLLALAAGRTLASVVYQASPHDPAVFAAVGAVLVLVGVASCWTPALRSLRIEPMQALRPE